MNTRARPEAARVLLRAFPKRLKASAMVSAVALRSRYSVTPARIVATMVAGLLISPTAKIATCTVLERISSIASSARASARGSMSTTTISARTSWICLRMGSEALAGNPT